MKKLLILINCFMFTILLVSCSSNNSPEQASSSTHQLITERITTSPNTTVETKTKSKKKKQAETNEKNTENTTNISYDKSTEKTKNKKEKFKDNIVIVLDAGHDSTTHTRNHPDFGFNEQDINLKITKACYKKLIKYKGVSVYMTRKDGTCPNSKYGYSYSNQYGDACIRARTYYAQKKKADIFISFHCNASTGNLGASANGTEVYVSKHPKFYSKSKKLGDIILRNLTNTLDLNSRGVLTRSKAEKGTYEDGTVKDFYYLISNNIDNERPSIIIEHAFMDNYHDNNILKNDNNLRLMGEADADGIAEYYDLIQ